MQNDVLLKPLCEALLLGQHSQDLHPGWPDAAEIIELAQNNDKKIACLLAKKKLLNEGIDAEIINNKILDALIFLDAKRFPDRVLALLAQNPKKTSLLINAQNNALDLPLYYKRLITVYRSWHLPVFASHGSSPVCYLPEMAAFEAGVLIDNYAYLIKLDEYLVDNGRAILQRFN